MNYLMRKIVRLARACQTVCVRRLWLAIFISLTLASLAIEPAPQIPLPIKHPKKSEPLTYSEIEDIKRQAAENTERYRVRVSLPIDAGLAPITNNPAEDAAKAVQAIAPPAPPPPETPESLLQKFIYCVVILLAGTLAVRRFAPDIVAYVNRLSSSGNLFSSGKSDIASLLLAEQALISEFQQAFNTSSGAALAPSPGQTAAFTAGTAYIREIQRLLADAARCTQEAGQRKLLMQAIDQLRLLTPLSITSEWQPLRQMACAMEMFLRQLTEKSSNVTSSTLRTATLGATLLEELCHPNLNQNLLNDPPLRLLVVDDEVFSRNALSFSLKRGLIEPDVAETSESALALVNKHAYDLIFLDVMMPGMDGFELCSKLHESPANVTTPVVFVTGQRDFNTRAQSILCGGRDLIAKPFLTFELTVKALTLVAKERLRGRGRIGSEAKLASATEDPIAQASETKTSSPEIAVKETNAKTEVPKTSTEPNKVSPIVTPAAPQSAHSAFFAPALKLIEQLPESIELIRSISNQETQQEMITSVLMKIHALTANAQESKQQTLFLLGSTLEGLLHKMLQNVAHLTDSALETSAIATALIRDLCLKKPDSGIAFNPPIQVLAVDDDPVALRALSIALQIRLPKPTNAGDGKTALALAAEKLFDVIFLDVQMPDMTGTEVCAEIRKTDINKQTPVVFVTNHDDPAMRAKSVASGGNDYIPKPFLGSEITLKALVYAIRNRLKNANDAASVPAPTKTEAVLATAN